MSFVKEFRANVTDDVIQSIINFMKLSARSNTSCNPFLDFFGSESGGRTVKLSGKVKSGSVTIFIVVTELLVEELSVEGSVNTGSVRSSQFEVV